MNKKTLWKPLSLLSLLIAVATQAADPIQYDRVNTTMDVLANAVIVGDDLVEYAKPSFDEKVCDLKAEKIKYDLVGTVKNTPWHKGTKTEINGTTTVTADRNPGRMGIGITSDINVKTDVLAMIRQGSSTAWKNVTSPPKKFEARIRDNLFRGMQVLTLKDLYPLLLDAKQLGIEMTQAKLEDAQGWLSCLKAGTCGGGATVPSLEEQIRLAGEDVSNWDMTKKSYEAIQITPLPSAENVDKLVIVNNAPAGFVVRRWVGMVPTLVALNLDANGVSSQINGFEVKTVSKLDDLHARLENLLVDLQSGEKKTKEEAFDGFQSALAIFKDVISGDWPKKNN